MRDYTLAELEDSPFSVPPTKKKSYKKLGLDLTVREGEYRVASITAQSIDYADDVLENMTALLALEIKKTLKTLNLTRKKVFLAVGLGNAGMTADALGVATLKKLDVTPHLSKAKRRICCCAPSVSGLTGVDSNVAVKGIVDAVAPDVVLLIDTLATADVKKLARVVQVKGAGLVPGGGVGSDKPSLDQTYLSVPVLSIGAPLVIYLRHVVATYVEHTASAQKMDASLYSLVVTPKEIDYTVDYYSTIIARAINLAVDTL